MLYLILALILLFAPAIYFVKVCLYPKTFDYGTSINGELDSGILDSSFFKGLKREDVYMYAKKGYKLHAVYIPNGNSKKTVVISHGYSCNLNGSYKYYQIFKTLGYNALLVDHRYHGLSKGSGTSFGYYEKYDLRTWFDWLELKHGKDCIIGTHGESMGAATVLLHGALDKRVNFIIADCPYKDLEEQLSYRLKVEYKLPKYPIIPLASLVCFIRHRFWFKDVSPIKVIAAIHCPTLLIHGEEDRYVPTKCSEDLYNRTKENNRIILVPNARHAQAYLEDPVKYTDNVHAFLEDHALLFGESAQGKIIR